MHTYNYNVHEYITRTFPEVSRNNILPYNFKFIISDIFRNQEKNNYGTKPSLKSTAFYFI